MPPIRIRCNRPSSTNRPPNAATINGMVMTAKALLDRNPNPSDGEIRQELAYNLCRCGTHVEILKAVRRAAESLKERQEEHPA